MLRTCRICVASGINTRGQGWGKEDPSNCSEEDRPMPFKRMKGGKYKSPSGRTYTKKQVIAYHASKGWTKKRRKK